MSQSVLTEAAPPTLPKPMNAAEIQLGLQKLNVLGRVLYVAAHPDDENTNLMALWSNGSLYDTAYLSLTRGDGGQNLLAQQLFVALVAGGFKTLAQPGFQFVERAGVADVFGELVV